MGIKKIQLRRDVPENWSLNNPVLSEGEVGVELSNLSAKIKIGDGEKTWNDLEYLRGEAAKIRLNSNKEFEASYDEGKTWQIISDPFQDNIRIENYIDTVDQLPTGVAIGTAYGVKDSTYTDESPKYRVYVYTSNGWVDNGIFGGISAGVVQETGDGENVVMSQKAVSRELDRIEDSLYDSLYSSRRDSTVKFTDIPQNDGYFYNLITKATVANNYYFTSEVDIPDGAISLEMRFEKSEGGIGVEFRDANGSAIEVYSNTTEPSGTKIKVDIPFGTKSIIFSYLNEAGLVAQSAEAFDGIVFYVSGGIAQRIDALETDIYGSTEIITDIEKTNGQFYNLLDKTFTDSYYYFYSIVSVPNGATSLEMRFDKSTGGGIGVEFRDSDGNVTGTFSNTTEPSGTKIKVDIPSGTISMIFSYPNSHGVSEQGAEEFDGIVFYVGNRLVDRVENLEKKSENTSENKSVLFYLSEDTGNVLQDSLTLEDLYGGYDELCELYPNYIKRIDDIGIASDGNPIRQYRIGYNKRFYQVGEGNYPEHNAANLWNEDLTLNKILVNAGTHGDEKAPCYATMLAFKDLVESTEPWAMRIKSNATIYVCPTLNPYGFQNRTLANANEVNINRDIASQTQPESIAWKAWIDAHTDAIAYIDTHGVDFYTPFIECANNVSTENLKEYAHIAYKLASDFKSNWDDIFLDRGWGRPYLLKSTYEGITLDYTESIGIKGFIVETPCDVVSNQYNPAPNYFKSYSKSNKMTKDLLINIIDYFISNK